MYFLKYTFLALLLWYVYYVAKIVLASLRQASEVGRLERRCQELRAASHPEAHGGTADSSVALGSRDLASREGVASAAERSGVTFAGALARGRADSAAQEEDSQEEEFREEIIPEVSDSVDLEETIAKKKSWWQRGKSGSEPDRKLLVDREPLGEESTCACINTVIDSWGFVEIVAGVDSKIKRLPVENAGILFGRSKDCDIRVLDGFASSRHARVFGDRDGVYLQDLDSRNGTYLNNRRLEGKAELHEGDTFAVGDAIFRYSRY